MSAGSKLNRKQEAAIAALLSEKTNADAAEKAGVGEATLQRWLRLPAFQAAYRRARQEVVERTVARLLKLTAKAVDTLDRNMDCGIKGAENRAAELALAHAVKGVETLDLAADLEELQKRIEELTNATPNPGKPPKAGAKGKGGSG